MTDPIRKLLSIAKKEVGYREGRTGTVWNNRQKYSPAVPGLEWSQRQPWCHTFVSWCAMKAGLSDYYPRTASTDSGAAWFKSRGQWHDYPAVGAFGYLGVGGDMHHVFLVVGYDATYVYTVEGNTNTTGSSQGDGVYRLRRVRRSESIAGYGYPRIPGVVLDSADPAYKAPAQPKTKSRGPNVDAAHTALGKAIRHNADKHPVKTKRLKRARAWIRKIKRK